MSASCIESKKDALQAHVSQQQRRPLSAGACYSTSKFQLPIWPSVANARPPRVVQRTQSVPRRGARPVLERMSADACRHPHTRAVNRAGRTVVEISLARLAPFGVWGFSLLWSSEPPHLVAGGWTLLYGKKGIMFVSLNHSSCDVETKNAT